MGLDAILVNRKEGFYWVKIDDDWIVAEWDAELEHWNLPGNDRFFWEDEMDVIGERIVRNEG